MVVPLGSLICTRDLTACVAWVRTYADITLLQEAVGFARQPPLEEGLARFGEWFTEYYKYKQA